MLTKGNIKFEENPVVSLEAVKTNVKDNAIHQSILFLGMA